MLRLLLLCLMTTLFAVSHAAIVDEDPGVFLRGDANGDGDTDIADVITINSYLFAGGALPCWNQADVDASGSVDISDGIYLADYLFSGGEPPAPLDGGYCD